jgi:hypothetical protein
MSVLDVLVRLRTKPPAPTLSEPQPAPEPPVAYRGDLAYCTQHMRTLWRDGEELRCPCCQLPELDRTNPF